MMATSNDNSNNATALFSQSTEIANPFTHSALDFLVRPSVLDNYEVSFDQKVLPHVGRRGPQLDSFVTAENTRCFDLTRLCLSLEACL